jgi:hypothetical protein
LIVVRGRRNGTFVPWVLAFVSWFLWEIVLFGNPVPYALITAVIFATIAVLVLLAITSAVQRIVSRADGGEAPPGVGRPR